MKTLVGKSFEEKLGWYKLIVGLRNISKSVSNNKLMVISAF